ncbi:stalk domain-containing protein [Salsuginibacillus kocurii]|uniref:stalk domain-containing protein n=1 Tax=Salsuginibacillus kocurii TaxID=427078 RepID=UPI00037423BA|nr:stalk domain-containing protein [Salsuginibacillus kocurii]
MGRIKTWVMVVGAVLFIFSQDVFEIKGEAQAAVMKEEPVFLQNGEEESLAEHPLLSNGESSYIPFEDLAQLENLDYKIENGTMTVTESDQATSSLELSPLPKEYIPSFYEFGSFNSGIGAGSGAVMENGEANTLYGKNEDEPLYPASTTKVMTALVALEHVELNETVRISEATSSIPRRTSTADIDPGDRMSFRDLLYALMVPSGNDAAVAIAVHVAGSEEGFIEMMNKKAEEIGALNTNFKNPHGLHDEQQYTTAYDLALIAYEASKYEVFMDLVSTPAYYATYTDRYGWPKNSFWEATNQQIIPEKSHYDDRMAGGKTGYTSASRHNLVAFAEHEGNIYTIALLRGERDQRYRDAASLLTSAKEARTSYNKDFKQPIQLSPASTLLDGEYLTSPEEPFVTYAGNYYITLENLEQSFDLELSQEQEMKLSVDGTLVPFGNAAPIMENDRMLVPVRPIFDHLGLDIEWDPENRVVSAVDGHTSLELPIGSRQASFNHEAVTLDAAADVRNGRTYVPARFVAEAFNSEVDWGRGRTLRIH